ncbi:MAG: hypothetical protein AB7N54_08640 [Alphaproteobacteria bacterium]
MSARLQVAHPPTGHRIPKPVREGCRQGIRKTLTGDGSLARSALVWKLPALIRAAVRCETHAGTRGRRTIPATHRFVAAANLDGRPRPIILTIREHEDGQLRQCALDHVEVEVAPGEGLRQRAGADEAAALPTPGATADPGALLAGVNCEDGTPVRIGGTRFSLREPGGAPGLFGPSEAALSPAELRACRRCHVQSLCNRARNVPYWIGCCAESHVTASGL